MSANTSEANKLADWLEMVASQADDGRKKDPKDKRRVAANLIRAQSAELASLRARCEAAEKLIEKWRHSAAYDRFGGEDHGVAALNRALEIYFSVNGEAADAAALAAVISDTRCMATDLWCMHILGPDDVHAAPSKFHAEQAAAAFNERFGPISKETDVMCRAVVEPWPHSPESHAADVGKFCAEWLTPQPAQAATVSDHE